MRGSEWDIQLLFGECVREPIECDRANRMLENGSRFGAQVLTDQMRDALIVSAHAQVSFDVGAVIAKACVSVGGV